MNFQSATHAEIEEPYTIINKDLYPDRYEAWKDSVKTSLRNFGTPLDYSQSFQASYQLPLNLIPIFDWVNADASFNATYNWVRGTDLEDGTSLGNTISNNRTFNLNGTFNLEKLYNQVPFLKKANERFNKEKSRSQIEKEKKEKQKAKAEARKKKEEEEKARAEAIAAKGRDLPTDSRLTGRSLTIDVPISSSRSCQRTRRASRRRSPSLPIAPWNCNTARRLNAIGSWLRLPMASSSR